MRQILYLLTLLLVSCSQDLATVTEPETLEPLTSLQVTFVPGAYTSVNGIKYEILEAPILVTEYDPRYFPSKYNITSRVYNLESASFVWDFRTEDCDSETPFSFLNFVPSQNLWVLEVDSDSWDCALERGDGVRFWVR